MFSDNLMIISIVSIQLNIIIIIVIISSIVIMSSGGPEEGVVNVGQHEGLIM